MDPPLAPTVHSLSCPPVPRSEQGYGGLGVSLGDSKAWKPQKVGGRGWTRCLWNLVLSHIAQDTARSRFGGLLTQTARNLGHFWPFLGRFLGISCS